MDARARLEELRDRLPLWKLAPLLLLVPAYLLLQELLAVIVLVVADIVLAAVMKKSGLTMVGLELTTVTAFVAGMLAGPVTGFMVGALLYAVRAGIGGFVGVHLAWKMPGYGLFGALAYTQLGVAGAFQAVVVMRAVFYVLTLAFDTKNAGNAFVYSASSLLTNFVIFTHVLPVWV